MAATPECLTIFGHPVGGELTHDDVRTLMGQNEQLVGKIQEWYGVTKKEDAEKQAEAW